MNATKTAMQKSRALMNRDKGRGAEEQRHQDQGRYAGDELLSPKTVTHADTLLSSLSGSCSSGQRKVARSERRSSASAAWRGILVCIEPTARSGAGLEMPAAFQAAVAINPMTGERRGWRPALARCHRAAKSRQVVIGPGGIRERRPVQLRRDAPRLNRPESCKSGFCECCEHRSPPCPLCAAGQ
jgi:hypothetical protein